MHSHVHFIMSEAALVPLSHMDSLSLTVSGVSEA